jgi:transposase-like protein
MPRKKSIADLASMSSLPILNEDASIQSLLNRVQKEQNRQVDRSPEQKIIALKILVLNLMQWTTTARQVGVDRKTLHKWWEQYGELIKKTDPEKEIVQTIENDVAIARGDSLKEWYGLLDDSAKKLRELVNQSTGSRSIYPIVEAVKAATEVIKTDKEVNSPGGAGGLDFYTNVYNTMINNTYGNDGN